MKKQSVNHEPEIVVKQLSFLITSGPHPAYDIDPRPCDVAFMHDVNGNLVAIPCWYHYEDRGPGKYSEILRPMNRVSKNPELSWSEVGDELQEEIHVREWPTDWEATVLDVHGLPVRIGVEPCFGEHYDRYRYHRFIVWSLAIRGPYLTGSRAFGGMLNSYHGWLEHLRPPANFPSCREEHPDDIERFATGPEPEYEDASWEGDEDPSVVMFGEHCMDLRLTYREADELTYRRSRWALKE